VLSVKIPGDMTATAMGSFLGSILKVETEFGDIAGGQIIISTFLILSAGT
jgi:hypothetical protein